MKLVQIALGSLLFFGFTLLGIRYWGLSQPEQPFEHAFWEAASHPVVKVRLLAEAESLQLREPDVILWLDLQLTADHHFLVLGEDAVERITPRQLGENYVGPRLSRYALERLRPLFPEAALLSDFLSRFPSKRFVLNVPNGTDVHVHLVEALKDFQADRQVLIQSDTDSVLMSIKGLKPMWLYGTSRAALMKLVTLDSVGLGPAAPFRGDVFISPMTLNGRPAFTLSAYEEMRRRSKRLLLGPLSSREEFDAARQLAPTGFVSANPSFFLSILDQKSL